MRMEVEDRPFLSPSDQLSTLRGDMVKAQTLVIHDLAKQMEQSQTLFATRDRFEHDCSRRSSCLHILLGTSAFR